MQPFEAFLKWLHRNCIKCYKNSEFLKYQNKQHKNDLITSHLNFSINLNYNKITPLTHLSQITFLFLSLYLITLNRFFLIHLLHSITASIILETAIQLIFNHLPTKQYFVRFSYQYYNFCSLIKICSTSKRLQKAFHAHGAQINHEVRRLQYFGGSQGIVVAFKSKSENLHIIKIDWKMESPQGHKPFMTLKMQQESQFYLFNNKHPLQHLDHLDLDDLLEERPSIQSFGRQNIDEIQQSRESKLLCELKSYLCLRTTPFIQILAYLQQYYSISKETMKNLWPLIKRYKLFLKRQHARERTCFQDKSQWPQPLQERQDIKIEDSGLSSAVFQQQSQQTRKKKRNRMSAQNSRDRKKEYIRDIQIENRQLKRKLSCLQKISQSTAQLDFIKLVLARGLATFINHHSSEESPISLSTEECEEPSSFLENQKSQLGKDQTSHLSLNHQDAIKKLLECLTPNQSRDSTSEPKRIKKERINA